MSTRPHLPSFRRRHTWPSLQFRAACPVIFCAGKCTIPSIPYIHDVYTRKNAWSVTAFNSTDIRTVRDNVATPVTAMMVTVCISTDALSSVFISPDLSDTNSFHQCCWSIMPVTVRSTDCNSLFPTYLYHSVTSDWYSPDNPTDCSSLIPPVLNSL